MTKFTNSACAIVVSVFLLSSCAVKVIPLELTYKPPAGHSVHAQQDALRHIEGCLWVIDERSSSTAHYKQISTASITSWLVDGIHRRHPQIRANIGDPPTEFHPRIEIRRAYIKHLSTSMSGVVQLAVYADGEVSFHRDQHTTINWWGGKGEFKAILNRALNDLLSDTDSFPTAQCSSAQSGAH